MSWSDYWIERARLSAGRQRRLYGLEIPRALDQLLEAENPRVPALADRYWNARGGSCTDGGAFVYTLRQKEGKAVLDVRNKFGNEIRVSPAGPAAGDVKESAGLRRSFQVTLERLSALFEETVSGGSRSPQGEFSRIGAADPSPGAEPYEELARIDRMERLSSPSSRQIFR